MQQKRFFLNQGVVNADYVIILDIPAGLSRGPIFLQGTVGYTSDYPFIGMLSDDTKKWQADIFIQEFVKGASEYKKIKSVAIEVPERYKRLKASGTSNQ